MLHTIRELVVPLAIEQPQKKHNVNSAINTIAAALLPVAWKKISINGKPVGVETTASKSRMLDINATARGQATLMPSRIGQRRHLGICFPGEGTSSARCAAQSIPANEKMAFMMASTNGKPLLGQPLLLVVSPNIQAAEG